MNLLKQFFYPFRSSWQFLIVASIPALLLGAFGLYQLDQFTLVNFLATESVKLGCEFLFLGIIFSLLQLIGIKNKLLTAIILFCYYLTLTADFILLWYFKERFGAKYLNTMEGGDYGFLTDYRVITYFVLLGMFCYFTAKKFLFTFNKKVAFFQLSTCTFLSIILCFFNPLCLLSAPSNFYTKYLVTPSIVYTLKAVLTTTPQKANIVNSLSPELASLANKYNLFSAKNTGIGKKYTRVILIASESLSNKYLHHYNPNVPTEASAPLDNLLENNPSASLKHVTLSTLYGLSVIFTSHPNALLSYTNGYPISVVRTLKKHGFSTAFLRGANETYMDEHLLFKQAGFDEVIGATFFEKQQKYKDYINWWGLTDRKLFEYAISFLKDKKDTPTFLTMLTVDSHVPLGRLDYLDEEYQEINQKFYKSSTLPRAFARFGQDVDIFLNSLKVNNLFDDNTLILITADHPSYSNTPTNALFKPYNKETYDNVPFIIITKNKISHSLSTNSLVSQLDIAPTLLDLLNLPQEKGFFGHSLFDLEASRSIFDIKEDYAIVTTSLSQQVLSLNSKNLRDKELTHLMYTFLVDSTLPIEK